MFAQEKLETRAKSFQSIDLEEIKRKRAEGFIELRKEKRSEEAIKRRARLFPRSLTTPAFVFPSKIVEFAPRLADPDLSQGEVLSILADVLQIKDRPDLKTMGLDALRTILAKEEDPPLALAVKSGVVPTLVSFLGGGEEEEVLQACWCLTNISAGPHELVEKVVEGGVFNVFPMLLNHRNREIVNQTMWALSNIVGDFVQYRNQAIDLGVPGKVFDLLKSKENEYFLTNGIWLISNLTRGLPLPSVGLLRAALSIVPMAFQSREEVVQIDACWILFNATIQPDPIEIQAVLDLEILPKLLEWLHIDSKRQVPVLKVIGNLLLGQDPQVQRLLDLRVLDCFGELMEHRKRQVRKEVLWALSNIAAGSVEQARALLTHPVARRITQAAVSVDYQTKIDAIFAIANATDKHDLPSIRELLSLNALEILLRTLDNKDVRLLRTALEGLANILRVGFSDESLYHDVVDKFEEMGGIQQLEALESHPSPAIYNQVIRFLDEFYGLRPNEEARDSLPTEPPQVDFQFS